MWGDLFGTGSRLLARRGGKHSKGRAPVCRKQQRKAKQRRRQANKAQCRLAIYLGEMARILTEGERV